MSDTNSQDTHSNDASQRHPVLPAPDRRGQGWREAVAWVVVAVAAGHVLLSLLGLVRDAHVLHSGIEQAARSVGDQVLPTAVLVALTASALSCGLAQPPTPSAERVLRTGSLVVVVAAALEVAFVVLGLLSRVDRDALGVLDTLVAALLSVALKLAAAGVMARLASSLAARDRRRAGADAPSEAAAAAGARATGQSIDVAPTWAPDAAVGAVWHRAGDAATGAAGQHESVSAAWQPERREDPARTAPRTSTAWPSAADLANGRQPAGADELPEGLDTDASRPTPVWRARDE